MADAGRYVLVTGGAGFIGANLTAHLLSLGESVLVFDNVSRAGVEHNLRWLEQHGSKIRFAAGDVRDRAALSEAVSGATHVYHLAAQVAVTTSMTDPGLDFAVNAGGTFNLLEAIRASREPPSLVFVSTNKVYGSLGGVAVERNGTRYLPVDPGLRACGVDEQTLLEFRSPYGCSKGAADQYVLDYARTYGLRATVLRLSCVYGPRQFGNEDQGWVAHFAASALDQREITVYGDGCQLRDVLFVDDLVQALVLAWQRIDELTGQPFNIGGGPDNALSLVELFGLLDSLDIEPPRVTHADWRVGDQKYYVSNTSRFAKITGWSPRHAPADGVARLTDWLAEWRAASAQTRAHAATGT